MIPVNINDLLDGTVIESNRIEFKSAWNPEKILHTICAFANDFDNIGGGYIVVGVGEVDGRPWWWVWGKWMADHVISKDSM